MLYMEESIKEKQIGTIGLILRGMAMGVAEVIPGVSGGTIAFITGIYERLIRLISGISPRLITTLFKDGFGPFWKAFDGAFLVKLLTGMVLGILTGIFAVTYMLEHFPTIIWSFFFGLIAASVIYMIRQTDVRSVLTWMLFLLSAMAAYLIVSTAPLNGSQAYWYVFISGAIAICALILPGISGSFILLIMGMYTFIIPTLKGLIEDFTMDGFKLILVFAVGCLVGLLSFSKVLRYAFDHYRNTTLSILSGLMLGSLVKIWPWRNPLLVIDKTTGSTIPNEAYIQDMFNDQYKLISESNVWPGAYFSDPLTLFSVLAMILGFSLVLLAMFVNPQKA